MAINTKIVFSTEGIPETQSALDGMNNSVNKNVNASQTLANTIRAERGEHRLRTFAIRESAGAIGGLSEVMVGPSGLTKAIQTGASSMFEFDFALKAVGDQIEAKGGKFASLGSSLASMAMPISIGIGAFLLLKKGFDDFTNSVKETDDRIKVLNDKLGLTTPAEKQAEAIKKLGDAMKEASEKAGFFTFISVFASNLTSAKSISEAFTKTITDLQLAGIKKVEEATKNLKLVTHEGYTKELEDADKLIKAKENLLQANVANDIYNGKLSGISNAQTELDLLNKKLSNLQWQQIEMERAAHTEAQSVEFDAQILETRTKIAQQTELIKKGQEAIQMLSAKGLGFDKVDMTINAPNSLKPIKVPMTLTGWKEDFRQVEEEQKAAAEMWKEKNIIAWTGIQAAVTQGSTQIADMFNNMWAGIFDNAHSDLDKFVLGVLDAIDQIAAKLATKAIISGLASLIPGVGSFSEIFNFLGKMHGGGEIAYAHSGLNLGQDERLIVAQTGERVLSRQQNKEYSQNGQNVTHNYYISAIDAHSFSSFLGKRENMGVLSDALKSAQRNGKI